MHQPHFMGVAEIELLRDILVGFVVCFLCVWEGGGTFIIYYGTTLGDTDAKTGLCVTINIAARLVINVNMLIYIHIYIYTYIHIYIYTHIHIYI